MKTITNIFYGLLILFVAFMAISVVLQKVGSPFRYMLYSVESGSMEPAVAKGALVVVLPQDNYAEGDVVTFSGRNSDATVTHRIVEVSEDADIGKTVYTTKGDANEDPDADPTDKSQVLGRVVFDIPFLGYPVSWAKTEAGFAALVLIPATIIVYSEINNIRSEIGKMFGNRKKAAQVPKETRKEEKVREEEDEE